MLRHHPLVRHLLLLLCVLVDLAVDMALVIATVKKTTFQLKNKKALRFELCVRCVRLLTGIRRRPCSARLEERLARIADENVHPRSTEPCSLDVG